MAIGIVETRGFTASVEALDAMCKDARVLVKQIKKAGGGHIVIIAEGDVAAVTSAVSAGIASALKVGGDIICSNVIANPHQDLNKFLN